MTTADSPVPAQPVDDKTESQWLQRIEALLDRASEQLNPILVKEARQALKSKQFLITFTLLLICGWGWSLLGIAIMGPGVYFTPGGPFMLVGYYFVLAVPLLIVVPFAAFRSLAAEREDGTFELLSITTLSSRQIVSGKLGSAVLQMLVYYSALSPCVVFTYLLRGIDIVTVLLILVYTFLASLLLAVLGLLMATVTRSKTFQVFLSVILLAGLFVAGFFWSMFIVGIMIIERPPVDNADFWIFNVAAVMVHVSFFVLILYAAAGQISFASDNRATRLRIIMIGQQLILVGWMMYVWIRYEEWPVLVMMLAIGAGFWVFMGSLMCGEYPNLSPRVKRSLPQSFAGRMLLTWLNPGSGTGYTFTVANMGALVLVALFGGLGATQLAFDGQPDSELYWFAGLVFAYVVGYLGAGRLLVVVARAYFPAGILVSFLTQVILLAGGAAIPFFLQLWLFNNFQDPEYTALQFTNWAWTLVEVLDNGPSSMPTRVFVMIFGTAGLVFFVNLLLTTREVEHVRQVTPDRVLEDEQQRRGLSKTDERPSSPFED